MTTTQTHTVVLQAVERDPDPHGVHVDWQRVDGPLLGTDDVIAQEDIGRLLARAAMAGVPVTLQPF